MKNELKRTYDEIAKYFIGQPEMLSRILKNTIPEYSNYSIDQIKQLIDEVDYRQPVFEEDRSIHFLQNDLSSITEGRITFDLLFAGRKSIQSSTPDLLFNIEIQNDVHPGYDLESRAHYYLCRMGSMQKNLYFEDSHYNEQLKCYSIWICFDSPDSNSHINHYSKVQIVDSNSYISDQRTYDLSENVIVYLGKKDCSCLEIINILKLVFMSQKGYNEIVKELKEIYGINLTRKHQEELMEMCNLSELFEKQGIQIGKEQGIQIGEQRAIEKAIQMAIKFSKEFHLDLNQILEENGITQEQYQRYLKEKTN